MMATIDDIGTPGAPLSDPPLTEWQAAVRDDLKTKATIQFAQEGVWTASGGVAPAGTSWNDLQAGGMFSQLMQGDFPGGPGGTGLYYVLNFVYPGGSQTQVAIPYLAGNAIGYAVFMRGMYQSVWYGWGRLNLTASLLGGDTPEPT